MTSCTELDLHCVWVCLCPIETSRSVYTLYVNLESCELASAHDCACLQVNLFGTKPRMADRHERFGRGLTGTRKRHTAKNVMDCASSGLGCSLWLPRSTMRMVSTPKQRMRWRHCRVNNRAGLGSGTNSLPTRSDVAPTDEPSLVEATGLMVMPLFEHGDGR